MIGYLIHFIFIISGLWFYGKYWCIQQDRIIMISAFLLKIWFGLLLSFLYMHYFNGGDSIFYYQEAERIHSLFESGEISFVELFRNQDVFQASLFRGQPRAMLFSKIVYFIYFLTNGNFWLISTYLSLFSFVGFWMFYKSILKTKLIEKSTLLIALFLWPSVLFWSSGLIKESFSVGLIMMIAAMVLSFNYNTRKMWKVIVIIILSYLLFKIKYYYAGVLIPLAVAYSLMHTMREKFAFIKNHPGIQLVLLPSTAFILVFLASNFHYNLRLDHLPQIIVANYHLFLEKSDPGKYVEYSELEPTFVSLIIHSPKALFTGLFRPSILDVRNSWSLLSALSNSVLLIFALSQLWNIRRLQSGDVMLNYSALIFCLIVAVFLGFSAPNFGTLVRYKAGFMPFFVLLILSKNPIMEYIKKTGIIPGFRS